ncbi:unnamed protein product, partial [Onchocerca flexuosa]|uniref:Innexin n=1 Tax=Onchocerca flexuosa TaxID=387005 RepID=A0A183H726_9BILA
YRYYVYTWITCFQFLTNATQITIYLIVFNVIIFMMLWSLVMSIITPTARVPIQYFVDKETDEKIKAVTPFKEDRYLPDTSTSEQVQNQSDILNSFAENKELRFVEVDNYNRLRALLTSIECIIRYFIRQQWTEQIVNFILVFLCVILFAIFGYYPLGELLVYHMRLAALNETTCEQAKPPNIRGDSNADYNMGTYRNLRAVFGWGLWAFPVDSHVGDGLHFPICYSERSAACSEIRYSIYREDEQNKNHF